jgi:hypothetical protein
MPRTQQYTLSNGGNAASGRLTFTSTNNLFSLALGDCNLEGLEAGASCTLSVTFTPATSDQIAANLSVQSPSAGETALSLSGRGRAAPNLTATNTRALGRANVNQEALREPENQFTWTVTNEGDLDSGALAVTNTAEAEFAISNDTCNAAAVAGGGTCTMDIRFRPTAFGARTATITVTDTVTGQVLNLALTGTGVVIAQPGQSCVNAECAAPSQCTGGVCCDRECVSSCQECSAAGVCVDQAERQPCGNGNGQCFGVDRCLLPETQPCTGDDQCGSGQCEQRLGGTGLNDRVCCLADCAATGQQCNPQTGQCQTPTLPLDAPCGGPGSLQCGAGLQCKECRDGGSRCTPPDSCCGGCVPGYVCNAGECGCPIGSNGAAQLDCGPGQCVLDRANACCPDTPECPNNLPVCDRSVGLCRQCIAATDCAPGPTGTFRACNNFQCVYACSTQEGFKDCGGGRCIPNNQCCGNQDCNNCQTCGNNGFCGGGCSATQQCNANNTCGPLPQVGLGQACNPQANNCAGQGTSCSAATQTCQCTGNGFRQCGNTCSQVQCCNANECIAVLSGSVCANGNCVCPAGQQNCGSGCTDTSLDQRNCGGCGQSCFDIRDNVTQECNFGQCVCPSASEKFSRNACRFIDGQLCNDDELCADNPCNFLFIDGDGDGAGGPLQVGVCGTGPGFVATGGDPDDTDPTVP